MSLLRKILQTIFHADPESPPALRPLDETHQTPPIERTVMAMPSDVAAVLTARAKSEGVGDNWRTSLDGLLTLLHIDGTLEERKELAAELNIDAGEPGSSEHSAALHHALIQRLAENGAVAPESFYK
jgi:hypothetical protein